MAKKSAKKAGRPAVANPKRRVISFKVDDAFWAALEAHRDTLNIEGLSPQDAARDLLAKTLRERGILK